MFRVEHDPRQVVPDSDFHQGITRKLLDREPLPRLRVHVPSSGQILVGNPFRREAAIGLTAGQRTRPTSSSKMTRNRHDRLIAMHPLLEFIESALYQRVRFHRLQRRFHQRPAQFAASLFGDSFSSWSRSANGSISTCQAFVVDLVCPA